MQCHRFSTIIPYIYLYGEQSNCATNSFFFKLLLILFRNVSSSHVNLILLSTVKTNITFTVNIENFTQSLII